MSTVHVGWWSDLAGRIGTPIFAATLVGCLLQEKIELLHIVLLVAGVVLIAIDHVRLYHKAGQS